MRQALGINDDEKIMMGISLGYREADNPVNDLQQPRITLEEFASLRGFLAKDPIFMESTREIFQP